MTPPKKPMCFGHGIVQVKLDGSSVSNAVCKLCYWKQQCLRSRYKETVEFKELDREKKHKNMRKKYGVVKR